MDAFNVNYYKAALSSPKRHKKRSFAPSGQKIGLVLYSGSSAVSFQTTIEPTIALCRAMHAADSIGPSVVAVVYA